MDEEKIAELIQAFKQVSPRTMSLSRDVIREGLLAVLAIVERAHEKALMRHYSAGYHAARKDYAG